MLNKAVSVFTFCIITCVSCVAFAVRNNAPAPDFVLKDTAGKSVALSAYKGKVILLNFWSTTCPHCLAELPSIENLYRDLGKSGLIVLGVAVERNAVPVKEVMSRNKLTYPVLLDTDQGVYFDSYGLFGLPATLIINKEGIVVDRVLGEADWNSPAMKEKLRKLL